MGFPNCKPFEFYYCKILMKGHTDHDDGVLLELFNYPYPRHGDNNLYINYYFAKLLMKYDRFATFWGIPEKYVKPQW